MAENEFERMKALLAMKDAARAPKAAPSGREQYASTYGMTPKERAAWVNERNKRIQALGPRPVDGVSFAKKGKA